MKQCTCQAICLMMGLVAMPSAVRAAELNRAASEQLGLRTAVVHAANQMPTVDGSIEVMDPAPLVRAASDLVVAQATASASAAEARRSAQLFRDGANVAAKVAEAAQAQAAVDAARVAQSQAEFRLTWGTTFASTDAVQLSRKIAAYVAGTRVLLRAVPLSAGIEHLDGADIVAPGGIIDVHVIGPLPQSSAGVTTEWLLEADGRMLVPGMHVAGKLRYGSVAVKGTAVPREAIVRWNGLSWVYVQTDPTHFKRTAIHPLARGDQAWLVDAADIGDGARVVVTGTAALLAIDAGASSAD